MDLEQIRTTKYTNDALQPARLLQRETTPEIALQLTWEFLDQQFSTPEKASQHILQDLLVELPISAFSPTALAVFALVVAAAAVVVAAIAADVATVTPMPNCPSGPQCL